MNNSDLLPIDGMWIIDGIPILEELTCPKCHKKVKVQHLDARVWAIAVENVKCERCRLAASRIIKFVSDKW